MEIYQMVKDAEGEFDMDDPDDIAELGTRMLNTVIHLGGYVEKLEEARAAVAELIEAAKEMNRLAKGPSGGVSQVCKKTIVARMDAALARAQGGQS